MFAVVGGIGLGAGAVALSQPGDVETVSVPAAPSPQDLSLAFRHVAEQSLPAIVAIDTMGSSSNGEQGPHDQEFFRRFFEENPGLAPEMPEDFNFEDLPPEQGNGSGFIIDPEGVVLTNSHVVEGAQKVVVRMFDGREYEATSWDYDPRSDVAVIHIEADGDLPVVPLGDSSEMEIGDWVLAMGNPFNVGTTVTAGIISAVGRGPGINEREDYLQTDAAINPGNSGGPLVNLNGEVVGINTAISTQSGGYDGVGFSIPINMAQWAARQLIEHGYVRRSYLGVSLQELNGTLRGAFGVPLGQGALVGQVLPNTPAEAAGLEAGDVILSVDGQEISGRSHLQETIERIEPGTTITCDVLRDGGNVEVAIALEEMPSDFTPAMQRRSQTSPESEEPPQEELAYSEFGFEVADIGEETIRQFELPEGAAGVIVVAVEGGTPASNAGLEPGDVISRVGRQEVATAEEFDAAMENAPDKGVVLHVQRGETARFVILKPEE
jgi:serine protease Do